MVTAWLQHGYNVSTAWLLHGSAWLQPQISAGTAPVQYQYSTSTALLAKAMISGQYSISKIQLQW